MGLSLWCLFLQQARARYQAESPWGRIIMEVDRTSCHDQYVPLSLLRTLSFVTNRCFRLADLRKYIACLGPSTGLPVIATTASLRTFSTTEQLHSAALLLTEAARTAARPQEGILSSFCRVTSVACFGAEVGFSYNGCSRRVSFRLVQVR